MQADRPLSVLYTGAFRFPDKDAAAFRVYSIAQILKAEGHSVSFAGWENGSVAYNYNGHDCHPQNEFREREANVFTRLFGFLLRGRRTLRWLTSNDRFDLVIAYNPPALFALTLLLLGKVRGFAVALDSTEWYDGGHLPGGKYGPAAVENWVRMHISYPFFRNVIAISTFLQTKFAKANVVRVPPLWLSSEKPEVGIDIADVIRFMYAGDAGKKDKLIPFIEAISEVEKLTSKRIELHIAGIDEADLNVVLKNDSVVLAKKATIVCYGRISRNAVFDLYRQCHFSLLFRENSRYAWAGFPTKGMESWSMGRPIVTNAVGDLATLARHLENAIIVDELVSPVYLARVINEMLEKHLYPSMVEKSLLTARENFSLSVHRNPMLDFIRRI